MSSLPRDLEEDAVGLYEIIDSLRRAFGLEDPKLERAARCALSGILAYGGHPVESMGARDGTWQQTVRYGDNPEQIVDAIIAEWLAEGRDPGLGDA